MEQLKNLENKSNWFVGGGIFAALVASLCCVGPLVLTLLGVTGAAALAKFEFLRIPMVVAVTILFSVAGYFLFKKKDTCEPGSICADPKKYKKMVTAYWIGLTISVLAITSPNWIVWLF